uniref:Gypsy retrotransposon integrase-like protein 1 n=1 Tax=Leptobrachium leishanense TaxID=445787 RepID=A0A8C5QG74_9ANUR
MLTRIHATHIGGEACYRQAQDTLYWPNLQNEIKDFVSHCSACNEYAQARQKEPVMSHVLPTRPWQIVSMDLLNYAGQDFLLIVDHYSDFWEIELLPDLSADTTIRRCKVQFALYGQLHRVISDNGPQFACEQFRWFSAVWGFEHVTSSPRHPQANGKAESAVKIVKNICKKAKYDGTDPWKAILHWRNTPSEGMDSSPAQRLMSKRLKTSLPVANKLLEPCVVTAVLEKLRRRKQIAKLSYDVSAKDLPELSIGEPIRMKPLPGDRTSRLRLGSACCPYLVDVDGSLYRHNRVDLRGAERLPIQAYVPPARDPPEVLNAPSPPGPHPQSRENTAVLSEGYIENDIIQPHVPSSLSVLNTPARREGDSVLLPTGVA